MTDPHPPAAPPPTEDEIAEARREASKRAVNLMLLGLAALTIGVIVWGLAEMVMTLVRA